MGEAAEEKTELKLCVCVCVCVCVHARMCVHVLSRVQLFAAPWTAVRQAPLSMKFSRREHWSGLPLPPPGDLPKPGIEPKSLVSSTLAGRFFTSCALQPIRVSSVAPRKHDALTGFSQWNSPAPGGSLVAISWRELNFLVLLPVQDLETSKCEAPCLANHCLFLVYGMSGFLIII